MSTTRPRTGISGGAVASGIAEAAMLPPIEAVDGLSEGTLMAVLAHLLALQARVVARLARAPATDGVDNSDRLVSMAEAAEVLGTTRDWLRRHPELPFVVHVSPGQVRCSLRALQRFISVRIGK